MLGQKQFPERNNTLGPNHINSGVSWIYNNRLMVWRSEECLKVFIHELFHCLGFDRFLIEKKCNLTNHYDITTHVNCNEGYKILKVSVTVVKSDVGASRIVTKAEPDTQPTSFTSEKEIKV